MFQQSHMKVKKLRNQNQQRRLKYSFMTVKIADKLITCAVICCGNADDVIRAWSRFKPEKENCCLSKTLLTLEPSNDSVGKSWVAAEGPVWNKGFIVFCCLCWQTGVCIWAVTATGVLYTSLDADGNIPYSLLIEEFPNWNCCNCSILGEDSPLWSTEVGIRPFPSGLRAGDIASVKTGGSTSWF